MAEKNDEAKAEEINLFKIAPKIEEAENSTQKDSKNVDKCEEPSQQQEEEVIKKKYGGLITKKASFNFPRTMNALSLISADWALEKVGIPKSKGHLRLFVLNCSDNSGKSKKHKRMAEKNDEAKAEEINLFKIAPKIEEAENSTQKDSKNVDKCEEPSQQQEEEVIKKKYGGLLPKKPPLIFQGWDTQEQRPLEAFRPKLQPTRHQQIRSRSAYARKDDDEDVCSSDDLKPGENQGRPLDGDIESNDHSRDNQIHLQN
ncbi:hypothetical protein PHJA_000878100 [Phtheirospermum japonicum]|uniref:Uncharacterized protein n=1 Tax=Phtheirospermum japonicum TaxID=374723 RepID=A0A830BSB4_9LAMI|nr:hypothetical protein PHJA_000878100 [Phtheirospermum japonicum]